ncbi:MAG: hypothetical protein ACYC4K_10430 [Thiobacillus sp.]
MKIPKYTDLHKFQNGYVPAATTDIARTFARIVAEQNKPKTEAVSSVVKMKGRKS